MTAPLLPAPSLYYNRSTCAAELFVSPRFLSLRPLLLHVLLLRASTTCFLTQVEHRFFSPRSRFVAYVSNVPHFVHVACTHGHQHFSLQAWYSWPPRHPSFQCTDTAHYTNSSSSCYIPSTLSICYRPPSYICPIDTHQLICTSYISYVSSSSTVFLHIARVLLSVLTDPLLLFLSTAPVVQSGPILSRIILFSPAIVK